MPIINDQSTLCPECHYKFAMHEIDTRNRGEFLFCGRCGYDWKLITIRDKNTGEFKRKSDGSYIYRSYKKPAFGAFKIQKQGHAQFASITKPIDYKIIQEFKEMLFSRDIILAKSYLTRYNNVSKQIEFVYGDVNSMNLNK